MLGVAPNVPPKDPAIVRRRSRGSLPRLHLVQAIRSGSRRLLGAAGANCVFPLFAIFLTDAMHEPVGTGGEAQCGASAEGWRERLALALFRFSTVF